MPKIDFSQTITAEAKAEAEREAVRQAERLSARAYLADTDWYVARFTETGKPIPEDVMKSRQAARDVINGKKGEEK